jgi:hypothetical protein
MYGLVAAAIADHDADITAVSLPVVAPDVA